MEDVIVRGVAFDKNQVKIAVLHIPDEPGVAARIFEELANAEVNVDMIIQSAAENNRNNISFTVNQTDLAKALKVMQNFENEGAKVLYDDNVAKISIVGVGMKSHTKVASTMFKALADNNVNIHMISTSEIKISCVIDLDKVEVAANAVHAVFGLDK